MRTRAERTADRAAAWWADRAVLLALGVGALLLLIGWFTKVDCIGPHYDRFGVSTGFAAHKNAHVCYSDIQQLWPYRGISAHLFPYVHGGLDDNDVLTGGALEYPVLTGLFVWLTAIPAHDDGQFLAVSALCLVPFGLLTTGVLARLTGRRALIWAAAPALAFYAFLNWDFLATAAVAVAVWLWWRGRPTGAAVLLAVGAAAKLYPAIFVLPLLAERLYARDVRGAVRVALAAAATFAVINVPFLLAGPDGWWATYAFQSRRAADITTNSIWFWGVPSASTGTLNTLTPPLILLAWSTALVAGWVLARRRGAADYPWLQVGASMLCAFLVLNKVHSPQYALWLLPFFCLIRLRWGWWLAYWAFDLLLNIGLNSWYAVLSHGGNDGLAKQATTLGVWGRAAMLALLFVVFLTAPLAVRERRTARGSSEDQRSGNPATAVRYRV